MKNNICIIFISLICIFLSVGCGGKKIKQKTEVKNDMTLSQEKRDNVGEYLFNADEMESIEISWKDLRKRKKCEMSTEITEGETLDFVIKREDVGEGISMKVFSENQSIDLISNLGESLEEEWTGTGAKKGFFYQMAACDINGDGEKEIIIAGGNKKDVLELRVLQVKKNLEFGYGEEEEENPQLIKRINGGYKAYLNDKRKICVIDGKNIVSYTVF